MSDNNFQKHILVVEYLGGKYYIYTEVDPWDAYDLVPKYGECRIWYICNGVKDEVVYCDFFEYWSGI